MNIDQYEITFPYGATSPPYSPSSPHRGNDIPLVYQPVIIKGTQIGISGATGKVDGPHVHIQSGRDVNAQQTIDSKPYIGKPGMIFKTGNASEWGNYVCIKIGDVYVYYCHLSRIDVKIGQVIGGDVNKQDFDNQVRANQIRQAFVDGFGKRAREILQMPPKDSGFEIDEVNKLMDEVVKGWNFRQNMIDELQKEVASDSTDAAAKLNQIKSILEK